MKKKKKKDFTSVNSGKFFDRLVLFMACEGCTVSMACGGCTFRVALSGVQLVRVLSVVYMQNKHSGWTPMFAMNTLQCCARHALLPIAAGIVSLEQSALKTQDLHCICSRSQTESS